VPRALTSAMRWSIVNWRRTRAGYSIEEANGRLFDARCMCAIERRRAKPLP